jgi:collagen type IV alpha
MKALRLTLLLGLLGLVPGCVACGPCQGAEATASPQSNPQSPGWAPVGNREPVPTPPVPRHDFGTPPTDQTPDEVTPPPPPAPGPAPVPPEPAVPPPAPPVARGPVKSRTSTTTTTDSEGAGIVISGNSAPVNFYSPGAQPATAPAVGMQPQPAALPIVPILTAVAGTPAGQSLMRTAAQRIGGGIYYAATGICPGKSAAPVAAAPQMMALQSVTTLQAVPVQAVQYVQQAAPVLVQQAPQYVPVAAPQVVQAAPQAQPMALAAPTPLAPKKCRLFGR